MSDLRPISLFNTLTRRVEPVTPLVPGELKVYNCGPTIYDYVHIGNLRTFLFQDLLRRVFETAGYRVVFCLNLTDVDDKIIRDSQKAVPAEADNGSRLQAMRAFTDTFERAFLEDIDALRIARPTLMPRATDHMADMIRLVQTLESRGLAYERDGSVYYRVGALPQYGCSVAHRPRGDATRHQRGRGRVRPRCDQRLRPVEGRESPASRGGTAPGARDGPAGTSSARRWR